MMEVLTLAIWKTSTSIQTPPRPDHWDLSLHPHLRRATNPVVTLDVDGAADPADRRPHSRQWRSSRGVALTAAAPHSMCSTSIATAPFAGPTASNEPSSATVTVSVQSVPAAMLQ